MLSQDPEGYAKACTALAGATSELAVEAIKVPTMIITGSEDKVSPPELCKAYADKIKGAKSIVLPDVGHWHIYEDLSGVAHAIQSQWSL